MNMEDNWLDITNIKSWEEPELLNIKGVTLYFGYVD
eukprot:CAMPEP_0116891932 /NCGR_PEP_ID=MMETSP0467-20121206/2252_1 /TAXON_ID=283647 /ORGANISM="Mesodinium pulex, Strain SPMC105" /LENGTH=35 /DNA_ID= /DNA_START= /DNA_END= /DNA_ORIENTATION=